MKGVIVQTPGGDKINVNVESFEIKQNIVVTVINQDSSIIDHCFNDFIRQIMNKDGADIYEYQTYKKLQIFSLVRWMHPEEKILGNIFNYYDGKILAKEDSKIWEVSEDDPDDEIMTGKIITSF